MNFDWDQANVEHIIEGHNVWPEETIEVLHNRPVMIRQGMEKGEFRCRVIGRTDHNRILTIVYTYRHAKVRIVTAFDAGPKDIRKYQGRRGKNA